VGTIYDSRELLGVRTVGPRVDGVLQQANQMKYLTWCPRFPVFAKNLTWCLVVPDAEATPKSETNSSRTCTVTVPHISLVQLLSNNASLTIIFLEMPLDIR
jgi:hypothetical protein